MPINPAPSGAQPVQGQTRTRRYFLPKAIAIEADFQFRHLGIAKGHVKDLTQSLRTLGELDPVLVWQEVNTEGQQTGRLVLLDGHHRLAAYAAKGRREEIPADVLQGDRLDAMLAAVRANSRDTLPLTQQERMDAAWRLVRLPGQRVTVPAVAKAAGVGPATVDRMRKRWKVMAADGREPTGHWWRDRQDAPPECEGRPEMTDAERNAAVEHMATAIRQAFGKMPWRDQDLAADALLRAIGTHKLRNMVEWALGGGSHEHDEFAEEDDDAAGDFKMPHEDTQGTEF